MFCREWTNLFFQISRDRGEMRVDLRLEMRIGSFENHSIDRTIGRFTRMCSFAGVLVVRPGIFPEQTRGQLQRTPFHDDLQSISRHSLVVSSDRDAFYSMLYRCVSNVSSIDASTTTNERMTNRRWPDSTMRGDTCSKELEQDSCNSRFSCRNNWRDI